MLTERFVLKNEKDEIIIAKKSLGLIFNWLTDNNYFAMNPEAELWLTEENTNEDYFKVVIDKNTTQLQVKEIWSQFETGF